ncbi:MAG: J domain-containing protein [Cyanobium sp.]
MASHYTLLQVPEQASADELRQAFRRLSKRFHPDTTSLPASEAEQAFQRLRQAYAVLSDPDARRRYDAELRLARVAASAAAATPASRPVNGPPRPQAPPSPPCAGPSPAARGWPCCCWPWPWCSAWCSGWAWPWPGGPPSAPGPAGCRPADAKLPLRC